MKHSDSKYGKYTAYHIKRKKYNGVAVLFSGPDHIVLTTISEDYYTYGQISYNTGIRTKFKVDAWGCVDIDGVTYHVFLQQLFTDRGIILAID
jgi:hypothetical protein